MRSVRTAFVLMLFAFSLAAAPASAANYSSVIIKVPVTITNLPVGTTARIVCDSGVGSPDTSVAFPLAAEGGKAVYHGPPIVVTIPYALRSGAIIRCNLALHLDGAPGGVPALDLSRTETAAARVTLP